jgi:thiol-disulfide isomerase/thioredoxin
MKTMLRFPSVVLATTLAFAAVAPLAAADAAADALWSKIESAQKAPRPAVKREGDKIIYTRAYVEALAERGESLHALLQEFIAKHPGDPRRWDAVVAMGSNNRMFVQEIGDVEARGFDAVVRNTAAQKAWQAQLATMMTEMMTAPGVPEKARQSAYEKWVDNARAEIDQGGPLAEFRRRLDVLKEKYPASSTIRIAEWQYLNRLRRTDLKAVEPHLARMMKDGNERVAKWAAGEMEVEKLRRTPMELKFTSSDGRAVDLAKLRGKVVLIDFWATWCGPCVAEVPNMKRVYDAYHAKGFEIIGISVDTAPADPTKSERGKVTLAEFNEFAAQKGTSWPHYYDGKGWEQNPYAPFYGITGIPAMFLLDKSGRLVSTDARGPKLEKEVKEHLGL